MHKFEQAAVLLTLTRRYNVNKMNKNLEKCINNFSFNKATLCWLSVDFLWCLMYFKVDLSLAKLQYCMYLNDLWMGLQVAIIQQKIIIA